MGRRPATRSGLASAPPGGQAVIAVADRGEGIARADLPHIFEKFYRGRVEGPTRRGFGLGLAIVRAAIDAHGGTVAVSSEPGRGSVFTVSLPLAPNAEPSGAVAARRAARHIAVRGRAGRPSHTKEDGDDATRLDGGRRAGSAVDSAGQPGVRGLRGAVGVDRRGRPSTWRWPSSRTSSCSTCCCRA